ncbi:TIGR02452 family protein [Virgisporangium ochraceum]
MPRTVLRMSGRLREVARATVAIAEAQAYRAPSGRAVTIDVAAAVAGTRLHLPDEALPAGRPTERTDVEVTYESTLVAARRVADENPAALVFASAKNPGGGFLGGAKAQEEDLARSSALYPCLLSASDFYAYHREQRDLRYSDRVIYSPAVPVFRDDKGALLEEPYRVAFLTAAAPNLGAIARNRPGDAGDVPAVLARRARRVLRVAAAHGHRTLVLGAWGCGVFRNDPATVASAFADALREVGQFDRVIFAIRDDRSGTPVYRAFESAFASSSGSVLDDWVVSPDDD